MPESGLLSSRLPFPTSRKTTTGGSPPTLLYLLRLGPAGELAPLPLDVDEPGPALQQAERVTHVVPPDLAAAAAAVREPGLALALDLPGPLAPPDWP